MSKLLTLIFGLILSVSAVAAGNVDNFSPKDRVENIADMHFIFTSKDCEDPMVLRIMQMMGLKLDPKLKLLAGTVEDKKDGVVSLCYVVDPTNKDKVFIVDAIGNMGELELPKSK